MIRPRAGDFHYSEEEISIMEDDIAALKAAGAHGFVFGAVTLHGRVHIDHTRRLITAARPLPVTFHRAFDVLRLPLVDLEVLISLGVERILTSGCQPTADQGIALLRQMVRQAQGRIIVVPAAGITQDNVHTILQETKAVEFHASARKTLASRVSYQPGNIHFNAPLYQHEYELKEASAEKIKAMLASSRDVLEQHYLSVSSGL